jgi:hypothetical protein
VSATVPRLASPGTAAHPSGLTVTLVSLCIIISLTLVEFADYRRVGIEPSIVVDKSRGQKLVVDLDVTFPRVPCYC